MSPWDVHVNRIPYSGKILKIDHFLGKHVSAIKEKNENEHMITSLQTDIGIIKIIQIAGAFARRIVPYIKENDSVRKGDKIGIVRFGSKVEILLPDTVSICVEKGDKIKAGHTIGTVT
jgi:phosphatidylserine decarboxylase